jgi:uncharacterized protein
MTSRALAWRRIAIYLGLVTALSALIEGFILYVGRLGAGFGLCVTALMWMPAVAAFLTCRLTGMPLGDLGWRWPAWREIALAWFLPLGYALVAYAVVWIGGWGAFPNDEFVAALKKSFGVEGWPTAAVIALYAVLMMSVGVIRGITNGLGEEIGWRGFLVPQLAQVVSFRGVVVISGVVWLLYHVPVLIFADYNSGTPWWFGLSCFAVMVIAMSAFMADQRLRTGSLWPAAIIHGSHNNFVQGFFDRITADTGPTEWVIGEFGVALAIAIGAVGVYVMWSRRRRPVLTA